MSSDFQKAIDLCIQAPKITSEVLKEALRNFLENKTEKKGNITYGELVQRSGGKLESIEVNEGNIKSFLEVAAKYDIDFSLKRDKSVNPPIYHVFFSTRQTDNFKKAFSEYAFGVQKKNSEKNYHVTREQMNENAKNILKEYKEQNKEKVRSRQKTQNEVR